MFLYPYVTGFVLFYFIFCLLEKVGLLDWRTKAPKYCEVCAHNREGNLTGTAVSREDRPLCGAHRDGDAGECTGDGGG